MVFCEPLLKTSGEMFIEAAVVRNPLKTVGLRCRELAFGNAVVTLEMV